MVTTAAQSLFDLAFENPLFSKAAIYTAPGGGAGVACRVLVGRGDQEVSGFTGRPVIAGGKLDVRKSEIAAPAAGGAFLVDGETLTIAGDPKCEDDERLVWSMTVR